MDSTAAAQQMKDARRVIQTLVPLPMPVVDYVLGSMSLSLPQPQRPKKGPVRACRVELRRVDSDGPLEFFTPAGQQRPSDDRFQLDVSALSWRMSSPSSLS